MSVHKDLLSVDLTLEQINVRDRETDEISVNWELSHPDLERPCRGATVSDVFGTFAADVDDLDDDHPDAIDIEELAD